MFDIFMDSRLESIESRKYTLEIYDLIEKHGFCDGDIFDDLIDTFPELPERTELLEDVIKHFYLPVLNEQITLRRANSSHNPIRLDGEVSKVRTLEPKTITVDSLQIIKHYGIDTQIEEENERVSKIIAKMK